MRRSLSLHKQDKRGSGGTGQQKPPTSFCGPASRRISVSGRHAHPLRPPLPSPRPAKGAMGTRSRHEGRPMEDDQAQPPESLLPYDEWTRGSAAPCGGARAAHAAANGCRAGIISTSPSAPTIPAWSFPPRLRAQYPQEMTIVLQHQFWDLQVDETAGCSASACPSAACPPPCVIPLAAVTAFADPHRALRPALQQRRRRRGHAGRDRRAGRAAAGCRRRSRHSR